MQPRAASGRVAAIAAATSPNANTTLVSLGATDAPIRTPARMWNPGRGLSDDAMRINAAMIGNDSAMSAKLAHFGKREGAEGRVHDRGREAGGIGGIAKQGTGETVDRHQVQAMNRPRDQSRPQRR
jgi:hypothetical protein